MQKYIWVIRFQGCCLNLLHSLSRIMRYLLGRNTKLPIFSTLTPIVILFVYLVLSSQNHLPPYPPRQSLWWFKNNFIRGSFFPSLNWMVILQLRKGVKYGLKMHHQHAYDIEQDWLYLHTQIVKISIFNQFSSFHNEV